MNEQTYTNSKGQTKPLYAIETRTGNPQPYRVMKRGVEVAAYRHKGLAQTHLEHLINGEWA